MPEGIYFPSNFNRSNISKKTLDFLKDNLKKPDDFFLDLYPLRDLIKKNKEDFNYVKNELLLFGCNIVSEKNPSFFGRNIDFEDYNYLYCDVNEALTPIELNKLGIWNICQKYNFRMKKDLNFISIERLQELTNVKHDLSNLLVKSGFKIINTKELSLNFKKSVNKKTDNNEELIIFPKCVLYLILNLCRFDNRFRVYLSKNKINKLSHIINKERFQYSTHDIYKELNYDYQIPYFLEMIDIFYKKLNEINELIINSTLSNYNIFNLYEILDKKRIYQYYFVINIKEYEALVNSNTKLKIAFKNINLIDPRILSHFSLDSNIFISDFFEQYFNIDFYALFMHYESINGYCDDSYNPNDIDSLLDNLNIDISYNSYITYLLKVKGGHYGKFMKKYHDIIKYREKGMTLEEIGGIYQLTRERVRQIASKYCGFVKNYCIKWIKKLLKRCKVISINYLLEHYPGLIFVIKDIKKDFFDFNEELGCVGLRNEILRTKYYIGKFSEYYEISKKTILDLYDKGIDLRVLYFKWLHEKQHSSDGTILINKITRREFGSLFLEKCGKEGFQIRNESNVRNGMLFFEKYGFQLSERNLITYITDNSFAVLCNVGTYIHCNFVSDSQKNIALKVLNEFNISGNGCFIKQLYDKNKNDLIKCGITNQYFLYGILSHLNPKGYSFSGRSFRIFIGEKLNHDDIIRQYMMDHNGIDLACNIKRNLHITDITLAQSSVIGKLDSSHYILYEYITIEDKVLKYLKNIIDREIKSKGFCHGKDLIDNLFFNNEYNSFLSKLHINDSSKRIIYILDYVLGSEYKFSHHTDSITDLNHENYSIMDIVRCYFGKKFFTRNELNDFLITYGFSPENVYRIIIDCEKVSDSKYVLKENLENDSIVSHVNDILNETYSNAYCITAAEVVSIVKIHNIHEFYDNKFHLLSLINQYEDSNWKKIRNDIFIENKKLEYLLVNTLIYNDDLKIRSFIREFIINTSSEKYVDLNSVNEKLINYEIIDKPIPESYLKSIFEDFLVDGLIEVILR